MFEGLVFELQYHLGELLRDQVSTDEVRWEEAVEDHVTLTVLLGALALGAPGDWAESAGVQGSDRRDVPHQGPGPQRQQSICAPRARCSPNAPSGRPPCRPARAA